MLELYVKYGLIALGCLILFVKLVDIPAVISNLFLGRNKKPTVNKAEGFLEIVGLWYKLKNKCDECHLDVASQKLDEVFPLLNGVLDDEKTI